MTLSAKLPADKYRKDIGAFHHCALQAGAPRSGDARRAEMWGARATSLRVNSVCNLATVLLLLAPAAGVCRAGTAPAAAGGRSDAAPWPSVGAARDYRALPDGPARSFQQQVSHLGNAAIAACGLHPRACGTALVAAGAGAVWLGGSALVDHMRAGSEGPGGGNVVNEDAVSASVARQSGDDAGHVVEPDLQRPLLQIARQCRGDLDCRTREIYVLLRQLPPESQLLQSLAATVQVAPPVPAGGWPPAAQAAAMESTQWDHILVQLADLLAHMYTPEVAAYQADLEAIAQASTGSDPLQVNADRLSRIEGLFQRDGLTVTRQPYATPDGTVRGMTLQGSQHNLHAVIRAGNGPRLLFVAHGDLRGIEQGSEGAYDNGSGVAGVLHVARQLGHYAGGDGQVELLITSHEEVGLLGSKGHVAACRQAGNCADVVINIDMIGRGGHGYLVSDSDAVANYNNQGQPPYYLNDVGGTGAREAELRQRVQQAFAAQDFTRYLPDAHYMITSDHLSFQNQSLPCVGLTQVDEKGADALWAIDQARANWVEASKAIDWERYEQARTGQISITAQEREQIRAQITTLVEADHHYRQAPQQHAHAPSALIHSGRDRIERVNPQMAIRFADVLVAIARQWCDDPIR